MACPKPPNSLALYLVPFLFIVVECEVCDDERQAACLVDSTKNNNLCIVRFLEYECRCDDPYTGIEDEYGTVIACMLRVCDDERKKSCLVDISKNKNMCNMTLLGYECHCHYPYTGLENEYGTVKSCLLKVSRALKIPSTSETTQLALGSLRDNTTTCDSSMNAACKISTSNKNTCERTESRYQCTCNDPYSGEKDKDGKIVACELTACDSRMNAFCEISTSNKNTCERTESGYQCTCNDPYSGEKDKDGKIVACQLTECSEPGRNSCVVAEGNKCIPLDPMKSEVYQCICMPPFENVTIEDGIAKACEQPDSRNCNEAQKIDCAVSQSEDSPTNNTCYIPPTGDQSKHECSCDDEQYEPVEDANGIAYICELKEVCDDAKLEACEVNNATTNMCTVTTSDDYVCTCNPPYEPMRVENKITGCTLLQGECNDDQQSRCKVRMAQDVNTHNSCTVPDMSKPDKYICSCDDEGYDEVMKDDVVVECESKDVVTVCSSVQKYYCRVFVDNKETGNQCIVKDHLNPETYQCVCEVPYKPSIDKITNQATACKLFDNEECSEQQNRYCMVITSDNVLTLNRCVQTDENNNEVYICECRDANYQEVKTSAGQVVNCTRKGCDENQRAACVFEEEGRMTGNQCILPIPLRPEEHKCICEMPFFQTTGEFMESICNKLPPGEFYLKKMKEQTVAEGTPVILECVVDRPVNICLWWRGEHKVTPAFYPNATVGSSKYTFIGEACYGVCSIMIKSALLTHDNTKWTCSPYLEGSSIPSISADIHVVVSPNRPWLEYEGRILEEDESVYIPFFHAYTKRIQIKCVSRFAFPRASHTWMQNGIRVQPTPQENHHQDVMSDTITTVSTAYFIIKKNNSTRIRCVARNNGAFQATEATFGATARTTTVEIVYSIEDDWFETSHGIILLEHPQEIMLQCVADGHPEPHYAWQEEINGKWQAVGFQESYIVTAHSRTLRCIAGNLENRDPVISSPVTIQNKGSGDLPGPGTGPPHVPIVYTFLLEPDDRIIGPGATFELGCKVNGPVHTCLWNRLDPENSDLAALPDFSFAGHKDEGYCTIRIRNAATDSLGGWICEPILYDGNVMVSQTAIVTGLYFSVFPKDSTDEWRFRPELTINGKTVTPGKLTVLNKGEPNLAQADVLAECNAYTETDEGEIQWKMGDKRYRKYSSSRFSIPSNPHVFLISSKVDFALDTVQNTLDVPHSVLMELGCRVVGRKQFINATDEWTFKRLNEIKTTLTLEHPTLDVQVTPQGPVYMGASGSILLICYFNGFPPPSIQWQEYLTEEESWVDIPNAYSSSLLVPKTGLFRCAAGNVYNKNGRLLSEIVRVEEGEDDYASSLGCSLVLFSWSLPTVLSVYVIKYILVCIELTELLLTKHE